MFMLPVWRTNSGKVTCFTYKAELPGPSQYPWNSSNYTELSYLLSVRIILLLVSNSTFRSQWRRGLMSRSAAAHLLRSWVRIPPVAWMSVVCCQIQRPLGRADHSYRGVLPTAVRQCVWSRNLVKYDGVLRQKKKKPKFDNCALLGYYATSSGASLPTFQDILSVPKR